MEQGIALIASGVLMLPTSLFQLIPIIRGLNTAPFWSYFFSLVINAGFGLLISKETFTIGVILLVTAGIFTLIPFDYCCCSTSFQGNHFAFRELFSKPLSRKDFIRQMCGNRALPPVVSVRAEAYHYITRTETVTVNDGDGHTHTETRTHREKVTTWVGTKVMKYASWEEDGDSIRIKETDIIHAVCPVHYKLDSSAKDELADLRKKMYMLALHHDFYASVSSYFSTPEIKEIVCGAISEKSTDTAKFYQGCGGRALWFLFTIVGYQSIFESIWCSKGERMRLKLKKKISCEKGKYRCEFMKEDDDAAKDTFRFDGEAVTIEPELMTNFYMGPPMNPEYFVMPTDPSMYYYNTQPVQPQPGMPMPAQPMQSQQGVRMQPMQPQPGMSMPMQPMQPQPGMSMPAQSIPPGVPMQPMQPGIPMQPQPGMSMQPMQPGVPMQPYQGPPMQAVYPMHPSVPIARTVKVETDVSSENESSSVSN